MKYLSKFTSPDGNEITYCGDNIKIRVKDKIVNNIFVFIPSDLNIPHVFMIYKILTGVMPGDYAVRDLYVYEIFTKLEACYPCVKDIRRSDLYNLHICASSIVVGCDKNGIRISVIYGEYDKRDIWQMNQAYLIGDKRIRDAVRKVYGYNWTNNLSKELSVKFNEKGDNNMKYPETAYISNDIEIHLKKRVINDITVYIPLYVKASDAVKIYDAIIGYGSLRPYEMLDELKKYYPYVKNIDRGEIDNDYIFIKDIGVFYEDTHVRIVVEYSKYSKTEYHIDDKRIDLINILNLKKGDNIGKDRFYSWHNINIHVSDGVIDYMKLYIPSDLDQISIYDIYDIITGYIPDSELISEERSIIVDTKKVIKKMYFYDLLDELKKYYPSLKEIHRTEIYNTPIYPKDINVCGKDKTIAITVKYGYTTTSFSIPNLSKIYSSIYSERYKIHMYLLSTTVKVSFTFKMSPEWEEMYKTYEEWGEKYSKYVETRPSTENDSKEKATIKVTKEATVNAPNDYTRQGRDIKIHASYGIIDEIKLRISSVAHSGICNNVDTLRIYDIMTGYSTFTQFVPEEKLIKIDKDKYIKKIQSYDLLDVLKKYYPCLEGMHRNKLYDDQLYPKNVNVCCEDNAVIITVKYGYAVSCGSLDRPKLLELYSSIRSEHSKLFDHLCLIPDNSNEKLKEKATIKLSKDPKELKKEINSVFGVPTFEAFDAITDELKDTYIKKNHDYGNSFNKSIDKFGLTAAVVRMNDKMERLNSLLNKDAKVNESIRDTVMDLANYCIMTAMYLDNKKENK